ncbi:MAG: hypothetical protein ACK2UY_02425 [Anaerolineae bacterium]|jgi:hypothetical protein
MDEIGQSYLTLALDLDRHVPGLVDAYFGPAELQAAAQTGEPRPLAELADRARQLQAALKPAGYDPQRQDFLERQVAALVALVGNLEGDRLGFVEEVERFFDITPEMVDEAEFEAAHAEIDRLLPGTGPLVERLAAWRKGLELDADRIEPVFELARRETRRRARLLFDLPPEEEVTLEIVQDQPWSAYNWYLGDYRSRIDLNTDLPLHVSAAVPLLAHEAYAGHHTEHAVKEQRLYREQGRAEHAVQLILAPECVISEGIGDSAQDVIFDRAELLAFLRDEVYPLAGLGHVDVEVQMALSRAAEGLRGVGGNAALLLHRDGRSPDEVQGYLERYGLRTPKEAAQSLKFLQNPLFRSYIFNYALGKALLAPLLEGPDAVANFRRLLSEPLTPAQVRRWVK